MGGWTTEGLVSGGRVVRELKPCGTVAAYQRHKRNKQQPCALCLQAWAAHTREERHANPRPRRKTRPPAAVPPASLAELAVPVFTTGGTPCAADPDAWFPEDVAGIERAKAACRTCPALMQCRRWVLASPQEHGVWGALSPDDRRMSEVAA